MADPDDSYQASDAIGTSTISVFSPSLSKVRPEQPHHSTSRAQAGMMSALALTERDPLLHSGQKVKKPFYRARPLWLVPFAISASVIRGMTLGPRIEVFTQLSCNAVFGHDVYDHTAANLSLISAYNTPLHIDPVGPHLSRLDFGFPRLSEGFLSMMLQDITGVGDEDDDEPDPRQVPSKRCLQDATVQAGAARLQVLMTITMGVLSALTTGWWGHFGELHGRTRVLAAATLGLFLTDLTFILVSTPHSIFAAHGHKLLIISPAIEGMLGGWQTLQAAINAYVSDCTSDGSRAQIFSRFTGVSFFGLSIGPTIGAFLITHPIFKTTLPPSSSVHAGTPTVTSVFYVAAICSFVNLLLALFVFPEAPKKRAKVGQELQTMSDEGAPAAKKQGHLAGFLAPFALLAPQKVQRANGTVHKDYRLTLMALTLLVYAMSTGIFQIKYLYAEHVYGWGAEQLSYYISAMGLARTLYLLALMPLIILTFKPKRGPASDATHVATVPGKKPPPTAAQVAREMKFDFLLLRMSLVVDMLSHTLVALSPANTSAAMFTAYTSLSSFGAGIDPAMQSLALCIMQANGEDNRGKLFGAFAMLRTVGQMIIGPMLFGLIYSATVAQFPKAIFTAAGGFAFVALVLICLVRPDVGMKAKGPSHRRDAGEVERGRSRVSKDISRSSSSPLPSASASGSR